MSTDPSKDILLLTSAGGRQAAALLPLLKQWKKLRLIVKSTASRDRLLSQYAHAEVIKTDLYSPHICAALIEDVSVIIHVAPSYHPHEAEIGKMLIDAAVESHDNGAGPFKHFILSSILNTQLSRMMNHDSKRVVEEYIMESGLPYTILQPTTFMDNIHISMLAKQNKPEFKAAWDADTKFSMIALSDLAAAMKLVLYQRQRHIHAQYPLVGTQKTISFAEAMDVISRKIGKEVKIEKLEYKEAVEGLLVRLFGTSEGINTRNRDVAQRMVLFYDNRGLVGNSNVLEWLLGRKALQFEEWVETKLR
ncbi:hypothetical protein ACN47E_003496 [Coniothyrium glycines]